MEHMKIFTQLIASELHLSEHAVENTLKLLDEGCTIPFISRYRKERTGGLDEVQITAISDRKERLQEIAKRKETITKTITEQQKMTPELLKRISDCWELTTLEDIYLPYKPKRRTRAQVAREQGLEPLATILMMQREASPQKAAQRFVRDGLSVADCLKGAQDIIAEQVSEDERSRNQVRSAFRREAFIESKVVKAKKDTDEAQKYSDYFEWEEPLKRCSSHRLLAMMRGQSEGILRISLTIDDDEAVQRLQRNYVRGNGPCQRLVDEAVEDGYKRLLLPSIETEFTNLSKEKADEEAIRVFAENLRQLLLSAPLGQKRVMGIDPGFRTGCKVVCLDAQGNLLYHEAIFPHPRHYPYSANAEKLPYRGYCHRKRYCQPRNEGVRGGLSQITPLALRRGVGGEALRSQRGRCLRLFRLEGSARRISRRGCHRARSCFHRTPTHGPLGRTG